MILNNLSLDVSIQCPDWEIYFSQYQDRIEACLDQIMTHVPEAQNLGRFNHLELSILLTNDQQIRELNRDYRHKDQATNVLSFPSLDETEILDMPSDFPVALGDIVFAFETIKKEAALQHKEFSDHFCHLCLHGMLHLLGYDHIEDHQAEEMEALEKKLLSKLSIDDPYQD